MQIHQQIIYCRYTTRVAFVPFMTANIQSDVRAHQALSEMATNSSGAIGFFLSLEQKFAEACKTENGGFEASVARTKEILPSTAHERAVLGYVLILWFSDQVSHYH